MASSLPEISTVRTAGSSSVKLPKAFSRFNTGVLPLIIVATLLVVYGLIICWSATANDPDYSFTRQLAGTAVGLVLMLIVWHIDYRIFASMSTLLLVINVVLILSPHLPIIGVKAMGAQSWIRIGMQIQPGEFAKVTVVLYAASLIARYGGLLDDAREYCKVVGLLLIPFICIMTQPDLGTGLVYLFISGTALVMGGAKPKYLLLTVAAGVAAIILILILDEFLKYETSPGVYEYRLLKQYQRSRLTVFLNPSQDVSGEGYNLNQAMTTIGSGGLFGKGLFQGTQATYGFLPEAPTDFIFCILAEELGFVGAVVLLALYGALVFVSVRIARASEDLFGMLIVCSVVGMWLFQILENIGMTCGLMPITGIPLPFVSYGSSFMVVNFIMLGLIGSVCTHQNLLGKRGRYEASH